MMRGGRKNLKQNVLQGCPVPQPGESIMRVISLRGANLIEVEDSSGEKTLCMLPAKFRKSIWIKIGNFVVVDEGDRGKAVEAGSKVTGTIVQVLYDDHIRALRKTSFWPLKFVDGALKEGSTTPGIPAAESRLSVSEGSRSAAEQHDVGAEIREGDSDDEDDGLPPLQANMNRYQRKSVLTDSDSSSDNE